MSFKTTRNTGFVCLLCIILLLCIFSFNNYKKIKQSLNSVLSYETKLRDQADVVTRILTETKNSFELYINREKIEYADVIHAINQLIKESLTMEQYLGNEIHVSTLFIRIKISILNMEKEISHQDSDMRDLLSASAKKHLSSAYKQLFYLRRQLKRIPEEKQALAMEQYKIVHRIFTATDQLFDQLLNKKITVNDVIVPLERAVENCNILKNMIVGDPEDNTIKELLFRIEQLRHQIINYVKEESVLGDTSDTLLRLKKNILTIREDVQKSLSVVQKNIGKRIDMQQLKITSLINKIQWMMIAGMILAIIIAIITEFITSSALMKPISILVSATQRLAKGDLNYRVNITSKDEIGKLAVALNLMAEQLENITVSRDKLREAQALLVQASKLSSIGELAAGIAHELNQPLMVIRTGVQLYTRTIEKNMIDREQLLEDMKLFDRNTKRMMNIINHLRTFSRQSEITLLESVHVPQVIDDALSMISEQLRLKSITVKKIIPENLKPIRANANQLEQVFINLLTNARDAILDKNDSNGEIEIKIEDYSTQQTINVFIKDTGNGIPSDAIHKIFDPFYTTKDVGKGTGLGLSISYGIIKNLHGDIFVSETGADGTTFVLSLPVCQNGE